MEWTTQRPRREGPLNCLHGTQDREIGALCLELCFPFPSAEPLMIAEAKGAFVTKGSLLWCCLRDQQCWVSLTWTFWNPVILGICFVLVLGKVWELPPYRRQVAGVEHGWTKKPLTPAQLHIHQFYIIEGNCAEAPTVIWSFWFCLPWHHFVQLVWLFMSRRLWL